jgi:sporulation protein YlmC with PRC-barrel domain
MKNSAKGPFQIGPVSMKNLKIGKDTVSGNAKPLTGFHLAALPLVARHSGGQRYLFHIPRHKRLRAALPPRNPHAETDMTTSSGHTSAILASKVKGTAVYNDAGDKIGTVEDVVLDKQSNQIMFAALGFGGILGVGEKYYPVPWSMLDYNEDKGGYVVPLNKESIQNAPAYDLKDLTKHDGSLGNIREQTYSYYKVNRDWN